MKTNSPVHNPYKLQYTVYKVKKLETNQIFCTTDIAFDQQFHKSAIEILAESLTISEAFQAFLGLQGELRSIDDAQEGRYEFSNVIANEFTNRFPVESKIIELIGVRRISMPELFSLLASSSNSIPNGITNSIQHLYLKKYITLQPAIQRDTNGRLFCMRCLQMHTIIEHNCGACGKVCYVCTGCATYGEVRSCITMLSLTKLGQAIETSTSLPQKPSTQNSRPTYPHPLSEEQQLVSASICRILAEGKNCLVWAVCGAGKTELVFQAIANTRMNVRALREKGSDGAVLNPGRRVLLATPRKDVVMELLPRLKKAFPKDTVHVVYGGSKDKHIQAGITIATTHQLLRYQDNVFDLVIIDEIDAFPYAGDPLLHQHGQRLGNQFVYMTATPDSELMRQVKRNELDAVTLFQRHHRKPLPEPIFVRCDSLRPRGWELAVKQTVAKGIRVFNNTLSSNMNASKTINIVVSNTFERVLKQLPRTGVVMFFVPSIYRGNKLLDLLNEYIVSTRQNENPSTTFVHAKDPERADKIADLRAGKYQWIVTTTILERGVTIPDSHVVVVDAHHGVFAKSTLIQIAGRVGRTIEHSEGKVIFIANHMNDAIQMAIKEIKQMNRFIR